MSPAELAERYGRQLIEELQPPRGRHVTMRGNLAWLHASETIGGAGWRHTDQPDARIWSDLHLYHGRIIDHGKRPFTSVASMNESLLANWEQAAEPGRTIVCGGDLAWPGTLDEGEVRRIERIPGRNVLVLGNHDFGEDAIPTVTGMDESYTVIVIDADPPLLVTHMRLENVPAGYVNVHGHVHDESPLSTTRHVNVVVEQLEYKPVAVNGVVELGKRLCRNELPRGWTTAERIRWATRGRPDTGGSDRPVW